mmetsp:Transcript_4486/g.6723  ORF Transcript_4486/g.6723 Transcript_4486/m.6723 type:complete len:83 (-) Transcript_4486:3882-4130(-)
MGVEFNSVRALMDSLFSFMQTQLFLPKVSAIKHIANYPGLTDLFRVTMVKTENTSVRQSAGKNFKEIIELCSRDPEMTSVQV